MKWKEELYYRLSYELQDKVMLERMDDSITFNDFTHMCARMAVCLEQRAAQKNAWNQQTTPAKDTKWEGHSSSGPHTTTLSREERKELLVVGKCFSCKQQGHLSVDCPRRMTTRRTEGSTQVQICALEPTDEDSEKLENNKL